MASALTISAPRLGASASASAVLPAAVGPTSASTGPGRVPAHVPRGRCARPFRSTFTTSRSRRPQDRDEVADPVWGTLVEDIPPHRGRLLERAGEHLQGRQAGDPERRGERRVEVQQAARRPLPDCLAYLLVEGGRTGMERGRRPGGAPGGQ